MGRPPSFSREGLQRAALQLVDDGGMDALSMRALARALKTGPMTLYNHVRDRADLELLLVDAVMDELRMNPPADEPWQSAVEHLALAMWRAIRAHPHVVPLIVTQKSRAPQTLDFAEALLAALARGGLRGRALRRAFRAVSAFVAGFALAELHGPFHNDTVAAGNDSARYPHLRELARSHGDPSVELRAGIAALLARPGRARPTGRR
ncbi:MAG TPA: TetR/AcrR family transcriptional regulator C-terminal domain-containing protein [Myxococcota bacterium]